MYLYRIVISLDKWEKGEQVIEKNDIFVPQTDCEGEIEYTVEPPSDVAEKSLIDWRYSQIRLISVDMVATSDDAEVMDLGPLKSKYLGCGVVKLYRDMDSEDDGGKDDDFDKQTNDDQFTAGTVMAIIAVPSYFTPSDILGFVGTKYSTEVSHFRMVRTSVDNRYMVLIKFRNKTKAKEFYDEYNGKLFNSMEAENCHVVFVKSIVFNSHVKASDDEIPYLLEDDFTASASAATTASKKPNPPVPRSLRELPTCPVCLERMDTAVTGLLTILCQHTFHCQCLSKWGDGSCPVCRYSQREIKKNTDLRCQICQATVNLWMCVVCGQVGCGRYDQKHAFDHYVQTGHCYSMDIESQRVWDYANDGYVHRLIQNEADGKLVELPQSSGSSNNGGSENGASKHKMEEIGLQYTTLLTSQLESQRLYYEDIFTSAADRAQEAIERAEKAEQELQEMRAQLWELPKLRQELDTATEKANKLKTMYQNLQQSYKDEKAMSQKMIDKLDSVTKAKNDQDQKVKELEEQLRDIMFFMDAKDKLANSSEDVQQGQVVIPTNSGRRKKK